jgi:beta-lactamase regulating signal transducer with metallopeptidase domain
MSLCEKNCEFNGDDENTKKAQCKCKTKSKVDNISEISQSNDLLLESIFEKENSKLNIVTMKCTYTLFSKKGIATNIGNYILLFIIIVILICSITFYKCGFHIFEAYIKAILKLKSQGRGSNQIKNDLKKNKKVKISKNVLHHNPIKKRKN